MRKFKPYLEIVVNYESFSPNLDQRLTQRAKKYNGTRGGSGYSFLDGARDISFEFKTIKGAVAFAKAARKFKAVTFVTSRSVLTRDD